MHCVVVRLQCTHSGKASPGWYHGLQWSFCQITPNFLGAWYKIEINIMKKWIFFMFCFLVSLAYLNRYQAIPIIGGVKKIPIAAIGSQFANAGIPLYWKERLFCCERVVQTIQTRKAHQAGLVASCNIIPPSFFFFPYPFFETFFKYATSIFMGKTENQINFTINTPLIMLRVQSWWTDRSRSGGATLLGPKFGFS